MGNVRTNLLCYLHLILKDTVENKTSVYVNPVIVDVLITKAFREWNQYCGQRMGKLTSIRGFRHVSLYISSIIHVFLI